MSELFAWVPWFQELASKIAADGPQDLLRRSQRIPWNAGDALGVSALTRLGEEIDPFSFFRFLASKNEPGHWERVHPAISRHFDLTASADHDFDKGFYFPASKQQLLFTGNAELYWRLFRAAIRGSSDVSGEDFDAARRMPGVAIPKLSQTLFLVNPDVFLPFDDQSLCSLRKELYGVHNWRTYLQGLEMVREMFPGCKPYEIQHFAYAVFGRKELDVTGSKVWQSSKYLEENNGRDYWSEFRKSGCIDHGRKSRYYLRRPTPGDLVLVRKGPTEGLGIGVVHRNDYKGDWAPEQRLHLLWLSTETASMEHAKATAFPFSGADKTLSAFRDTTAYRPTFALLEGLGWKDDSSGPSPEPGSVQIDDDELPPGPDLRALAEATSIDESELQEIWELLDDKKQVIFQGPPGTGKTYIARKLAACLAGNEDRVRLVQFHPSYAYEDFVQGFRPTLSKEHGAGFKLRNGPLLRMAKRAKKEPGEKHFLIVDEINRGNLAKILGELYFLLEYRDDHIRLQYSNKLFSLPPNLYIIGTMNTADRSIALVDLALRRRFHFVEFHPDKPPIQGLLGRWLEKHELDEEFGWVENVIQKANEKLDDRHAALGPSYFMPRDRKLDAQRIRRIWEHNVLPYVEERLFGQEDRLQEFDLGRLRKEAEGRPAPSKGEPADEVSGTGKSGDETA